MEIFFFVQQDCKEEAAGAPAPGDGPACVWAIQTEAAPTNVTSAFPKQQLENYSRELKIARNKKVRLKEERDLPESRWHQALCGVPSEHQVEHSTAPAFREAAPHPKHS